MQKNKTAINPVFPAIFLIACSMLMFEILLTRICALRLFFHFGFLVISNCLLGMGASGTMVFILQEKLAKRRDYWLRVFTGLYLVSLVFTYMFLLNFNIEQGINFTSLVSMLRFFLFNFASAVPFFFAGTIIGMLLTFNAEQVNKVYGFDLLGAGLGCLLTPLFLALTGAGGTVVFVILLALAVLVIYSPKESRRIAVPAGVVIGLLGLALLPIMDKSYPVPSKNEIFITGKRGLEFQKSIVYSRWSATSRVDLVNLDINRRFILGMGKDQPFGAQIPDEKWIMQDGSAGTYIINFSESPEALGLLKRSLYSTAYMLKEKPRVFIIGVGGGNDVWAAKANGASYIKGIELNKQILDIHRRVLPRFSGSLTTDPNIDLVFDEGRSALMRDQSKYDVIQMSGIDTWTSLTSGAYILAENYLYTTEAMRTVYDNLAENGIMAITRFASTMETTRLFSNITAALEDQAPGLDKSMVCLGHGVLRTILVKKGAFNAGEMGKLEDFSQRYGFPFVYHPNKDIGNTEEKFLRSPDRARFIREFPRDISPTPDDRPYFFNFTRWSKLFSSTKHLKEHASVSQGNPLFIFGQLLVSTVLALLFIMLPVVLFMRKKMDRAHLGRFLLYFSGLGMGFIAIEIALMQKLVLFLGHPLYSITVTLFAMLVFAGIGSVVSNRWFSERGGRSWLVPVGLAALLGLFILFSPGMVTAWIAWPTAARVLMSIVILAPISLLLGVPFAYGIRLLNRHNPTLVPWAWAVNGSTTVIGSILAVIISMNLGFNAVLMGAVLVYFMSFIAIRKLT